MSGDNIMRNMGHTTVSAGKQSLISVPFKTCTELAGRAREYKPLICKLKHKSCLNDWYELKWSLNNLNLFRKCI